MSDRLMCCETSAHASDCPNNPNSLGFDEPGLWMVDEWIDEGVVGAMHKPSDADLIAAVRSRVESGTIKGKKEWRCRWNGAECFGADDRQYVEGDHERCGHILAIPVSDGGSETDV